MENMNSFGVDTCENLCRYSMCEDSNKPKHFWPTVVCKRLVSEICWRIRNFVPKANFLQFPKFTLYFFD